MCWNIVHMKYYFFKSQFLSLHSSQSRLWSSFLVNMDSGRVTCLCRAWTKHLHLLTFPTYTPTQTDTLTHTYTHTACSPTHLQVKFLSITAVENPKCHQILTFLRQKGFLLPPTYIIPCWFLIYILLLLSCQISDQFGPDPCTFVEQWQMLKPTWNHTLGAMKNI